MLSDGQLELLYSDTALSPELFFCRPVFFILLKAVTFLNSVPCKFSPLVFYVVWWNIFYLIYFSFLVFFPDVMYVAK